MFLLLFEPNLVLIPLAVNGTRCASRHFCFRYGLFPHSDNPCLSDGMRRPVSAGCDTLPTIDALKAQWKGDRL
jgi:hypothetical protein